MKREMKKNKKLLLDLVLFNCCVLMLLTYLSVKLKLFYEDNDVFSWRTFEINIPSDKNMKFDLSVFQQDEDEFFVYKNYNEDNFKVRGIFLSSANKFSLKTGSFENINTLINVKKAVIGSGLTKNIYTIDNKPYILIGDQKFEVIGLLDERHNKWFQYSILIPLLTSVEMYGLGGQYYIDGSAQNVKRVYNQIIKKRFSTRE